MKIKSLALLLFAAVLASCSTMMATTEIKNTSWKLSEFPNGTIPTNAEATLSFNGDSSVSGKSFCNGYGGTFKQKGNSLTFSQTIGTMMYCDHVGNAETKYLEAYSKTNKVKVEDSKLYLMENDKVLLIFTKTP